MLNLRKNMLLLVSITLFTSILSFPIQRYHRCGTDPTRSCLEKWSASYYNKYPRLGETREANMPSLRMFDSQNSLLESAHSSTLLTANLFEEDLPNIFGLNILEAAIIIGGLYYVYGPTKLYEYARAAGRFVSEYLPIVQQVSSDIFAELKDYFDEDRERELLKKQGFDLENIPRRTSNVFERVQQSLASLSDSSASDSASSASGIDPLQAAYAAPAMASDDLDDLEAAERAVEASKIDPSSKRRKSKKEVLIEKKVDLNEVC
jgi:Sec-independent protein translocase protein TatA